MAVINEWIAALAVACGCLFCLVAAVGMIRLPDTLVRMHAATKAGTLGAGLILVGVAATFWDVATVLRALLTLIFLFLTAPVAAHLIGRAAYCTGIQLSPRTWVDHLVQDRHCESRVSSCHSEQSASQFPDVVAAKKQP
jgi:multicomponent Na+:H+ antiporter subunit G